MLQIVNQPIFYNTSYSTLSPNIIITNISSYMVKNLTVSPKMTPFAIAKLILKYYGQVNIHTFWSYCGILVWFTFIT